LDIVDAIGLVKAMLRIPFVRPHIAIDALPKMAEAFTEAAISHGGRLSINTRRNETTL
jgi:hypothetical protein